MTFGVHIFGPHDRNVSACNGLCSASCGIFPPVDRIVKLYMIVIFVELNTVYNPCGRFPKLDLVLWTKLTFSQSSLKPEMVCLQNGIWLRLCDFLLFHLCAMMILDYLQPFWWPWSYFQSWWHSTFFFPPVSQLKLSIWLSSESSCWFEAFIN